MQLDLFRAIEDSDHRGAPLDIIFQNLLFSIDS